MFLVNIERNVIPNRALHRAEGPGERLPLVQ